MVSTEASWLMEFYKKSNNVAKLTCFVLRLKIKKGWNLMVSGYFPEIFASWLDQALDIR